MMLWCAKPAENALENKTDKIIDLKESYQIEMVAVL